jgi:Holliday junction resolvasome RuvABC endonuclease subunit
MKVLGIDPGIASCGWAVVNTSRLSKSATCGTIKTKPAVNLLSYRGAKAHDLDYRIGEVLGELAKQVEGVELIAIEGWEFQGKKRGSSPNAANISRLIGRIEGLAQELGIRCVTMPTSEIKRALGAGDKAGIQTVLKTRGYSAGSSHEWDAIAAAIVGAQRVRLERGRRV